jgi:hypothetical protein
MKKLYARTSAALACALCVTACGGSGNNLQLGGTVYGMTKTGLTLTNNGGPEYTVTPAATSTGSSTFVFPELVGTDEKYNVQVKNQPEGSTCTGQYNTGTTGAYSVSSVVFYCANVPRNLGGSVTGLKYDGLVLNNGNVKLAVGKDATTFTFTSTTTVGTKTTTTGQVGDGEPFGVTVLEQPKLADGVTVAQICTVSNGTGIMGHTDYNGLNGVNGVLVTCVDK